MQSGSTPGTRDYFADLELPNINDMELQLQKMVEQGVITPEQAKAELVNRSEMDNITTDPATKKAQMDALVGLQDISSSGGMTDTDRANLNKIRSDEDTAARGKREAIIQGAQARGLGGSGLDLMSQMQNQQDSATRTSQRDMDIAGQSKDRALQALIQGGQLGGQIQAQDFNQQAQKAGANDAIAKFNAQNKQNINLANTSNNNNAQVMNLQNKQNVANQNVALNNQQQEYNKQLQQRQFDNELRKRSGQAGIAQTNSAAAGQNSQNQANATNQTISTGIATAAMMMSDERQKENIEDFSASDFLDSLVGKKYNYKDKKHGAGKKAGVMAQDLEKTDIGAGLVHDTNEGKVVDYNKAGPPMLASIADLHKRLKKFEKGEI